MKTGKCWSHLPADTFSCSILEDDKPTNYFLTKTQAKLCFLEPITNSMLK